MTASAVCSLPGQQALTAKKRKQQATVDTIWQFNFSSVKVPQMVQSTYIFLHELLSVRSKEKNENCSATTLNMPGKEWAEHWFFWPAEHLLSILYSDKLLSMSRCSELDTAQYFQSSPGTPLGVITVLFTILQLFYNYNSEEHGRLHHTDS